MKKLFFSFIFLFLLFSMGCSNQTSQNTNSNKQHIEHPIEVFNTSPSFYKPSTEDSIFLERCIDSIQKLPPVAQYIKLVNEHGKPVTFMHSNCSIYTNEESENYCKQIIVGESNEHNVVTKFRFIVSRNPDKLSFWNLNENTEIDINTWIRNNKEL